MAIDPFMEIDALSKVVRTLTSDVEKLIRVAGAGFGAPGRGTAGNILSSSLGMIGGIGGGAFNMMPNVAATVQRAGGYYNASVAMGGINRANLERATFNGLAGGLSAPGVDAMVANTLSTMGVAFSTSGTSQYMRVVQAAGNATKYLNMDTNSAAAAIAGMNTGAMSANLMRNFGIATSDRNGNPLKQSQIFEQLAQRLTAGRGKASVRDTMNSLYQGNLGATIQASGLSADNQALFAQYMIERSKGVQMDLSDPKTMSRLQAGLSSKGNDNPFAAAYSMNASSTSAMGKSESAFIQGLGIAADNLKVLNDISGQLGASFGALNSWAQAISGSQVGKGALQTGSAILSGGANIAKDVMIYNALSGKGAGGTGGVGSSSAGFFGNMMGKAKSGIGPMLKGNLISFGAGLAGEGIKAVSGNQQGSVGNKIGNALSTAGTFASMASMLNLLGPEVGVPAMAIAGLLGGVVGAFTGGQKSAIGTGSGAGAAGSINLMKPSNGPITAYYGEKGPMWGAQGHGGIDFGVPEGSPVVAAHDGVVSYENSEAVGNVIRITSPDKSYATVYFHLSDRVAPPGATVSQGMLIAHSGATGKQLTGPHLHFGLFIRGVRTNPAPYLGLAFSSSAISAATWGKKSSSVLSSGPSLGTASTAAPDLITVSAAGVQGVSPNVSTATASHSSSSTTTGVGGRVSGRSMGNRYLSNVRGASEGILNVSKDGPVNVHQGETILPADVAKDYRKDQVFGKKHQGNFVQINLTIGQASESEARKFAQRVKQLLEDDNRIHSMGAH